MFAALVGVFARHAHMGSGERRVVVGALGLWFLSSCHDAAVVAGWVSGPFLIVFGYLGFSLAFTAVLLRRFARALEHVEENADVLHRLVEEQTAELRRRELALAHGERMATLGTLAAGVAHEINNPIAFVSSNLNHLAEAWKQGDDEPVEDILAETREGVDRIRGIVVELLSLARRGDGRNERVDLNQVVQSVLPLLRHQALDRARLETQLTDLPPVLGDPGLLGQVVLNLALNSLHAMESGSPRSNCLTLSTAFEDGSVWLMVRDTGAGIPDEVLPHIFDPFFTTKEQGKGTGLGLAVTHQIVTRHRGRLDVETGETGTTITVELPPDTGFASAETAAGR
ncbi:MAG: ATP-binding protein [Myxococcota bacterium]|nr:ATP-binding protein [Myxococcota bacterium]